ncbi:Hypothetical protein (Fragment) [Durusdinium trenchii]|uniref:DUF3598 domain-containing protein n=1 Tax=Durusdinium trenchii TaxID=1381693 RepID=A0ABP0Q7Q7_9DINO
MAAMVRPLESLLVKCLDLVSLPGSRVVSWRHGDREMLVEGLMPCGVEAEEVKAMALEHLEFQCLEGLIAGTDWTCAHDASATGAGCSLFVQWPVPNRAASAPPGGALNIQRWPSASIQSLVGLEDDVLAFSAFAEARRCLAAVTLSFAEEKAVAHPRGACSLEHLLVALETTIRAQLAMPRSSGFSHFVEKVAAADSDAQKDGVEVLFGLCGTWHGTWQRLSVEGPSLKSAQRFRATCAPCVAADGESVHHVNRYPPEVAPKPGLLGSDGMMEVDFGQMNKSNFLQPFGPRSSASYGSGWAALYPSSWQTERLAVELISRVGAQRHRLIAMWQRKDEDVALTMLTSIRESQADGSERVFGTGSSEHGEEHVAEQVEEDWYTLSPSTFALVPRQLSSSGDFQIGLAWATASDDAWNGLIANFSQHLQSVQLPK